MALMKVFLPNYSNIKTENLPIVPTSMDSHRVWNKDTLDLRIVIVYPDVAHIVKGDLYNDSGLYSTWGIYFWLLGYCFSITVKTKQTKKKYVLLMGILIHEWTFFANDIWFKRMLTKRPRRMKFVGTSRLFTINAKIRPKEQIADNITSHWLKPKHYMRSKEPIADVMTIHWLISHTKPIVKPVLRDRSRDRKKYSLLTQVNNSEKCAVGGLNGQSLNSGGL